MKGWWLFTDVEVRRNDPWISQSAWRNVLTKAGFMETAFLSDVREAGEALNSVILARGPAVQQDSEPAQTGSDGQEDGGAWLIFADRRGVARELAGRLKQRGFTPILVTPGPAFLNTGPEQFEARPDRPEDMVQLMEAVLAHPGGCRRIVHLWSLDAGALSGTATGSLRQAQKTGCINVLYLVQALAKLTPDRMPGLSLITSGVNKASASDRAISMAQAPLWGLGRVITTEHPALDCRMIDLGPDCTPEETHSLVDELTSNERDDEVAIRGGARFVRRLVRTSLVDVQRRSDAGVSSGTTRRSILKILRPARWTT